MKKLLFATLIGLAISTSSFAASQVMCHFNSFVEQHNDRISKKVTSSHDIVIVNTTTKNQHYFITYQTFIDKNVVNVKNFEITLVPNQKYEHHANLDTWRLFRDKKNYDASCRTTINGDEDNQINGGGYIRIW